MGPKAAKGHSASAAKKNALAYCTSRRCASRRVAGLDDIASVEAKFPEGWPRRFTGRCIKPAGKCHLSREADITERLQQ